MRQVNPSAIFKWSLLGVGLAFIFGLVAIILAPVFWNPNAEVKVVRIGKYVRGLDKGPEAEFLVTWQLTNRGRRPFETDIINARTRQIVRAKYRSVGGLTMVPDRPSGSIFDKRAIGEIGANEAKHVDVNLKAEPSTEFQIELRVYRIPTRFDQKVIEWSKGYLNPIEHQQIEDYFTRERKIISKPFKLEET